MSIADLPEIFALFTGGLGVGLLLGALVYVVNLLLGWAVQFFHRI